MGAPHTAGDGKKRAALGKGIESLLGPRVPPPAPVPAIAAVAEEPTGKPLEIPVEKIDRSPFQTRMHFDKEKLAELAQSIAAMGLLQPVVVRETAGGRFQLIAGERRLRASVAAGRSTIAAWVRQANDENSMILTVVENLQREDLNPIEEAKAFERLSREFKLTQEEIAKRTGKERSTVANFLRLLKLPVTVQNWVEEGRLDYGHARALLGLETEEQIIAAATRVANEQMSVRQTEEYVLRLTNPERLAKKEQKSRPPQDPNVKAAEDKLREKLGLKVAIEDRRGKGKVILEYANIEDFDRILEALG